MSYATVLLHLDAHPGLNDRIDQAARLARRFECHLVGLAAADHGLSGLGVETGFAGTPRLAHAVEQSRAAASSRACQFQERLNAVSTPVSFEAVVDDGEEVTALVRRSTCCDLLVVGQPDPAWSEFARCRDQLERIVLQSVAPTLVLPCRGQHSLAADNMMIAWDGSHGAARAVVGALPLLRRARRVHLVRCETGVEIEHGVRLEAMLERSGGDVVTSLLTRAGRLGADLIVMGAWGMPRWAERLVGGATRSMLASTNVPILTSH
jgi:hypothetical protein